MKPSILLLLLLSTPLLAQNNYVATTPTSATPGSDNVIVGLQAGNDRLTGYANTFIGNASGTAQTTGRQNTFVGNRSGASTTSGYANVFMGVYAGGDNTLGYYNTAIGYLAGSRMKTSVANTFVGSNAGANTLGVANTFLGAGTGGLNVDGNNNTFVGSGSGTANVTGSDNLFMGAYSGANNFSGGVNVFIGSNAGYSNTSGSGNLFLGQQAGYFSKGSYNLFMGNSSGSSTTSGLGNTAIGDGSLLRNETGIHNAAIGRYAGVESRGDENVFIGFAADVVPGNFPLTNATAIGARAHVSQSNSIVLGANANVGIGNGAPSAKLHITTGTANTSGLRLENLTISSTATGGQTKFLTVDGSGNVILGSLSGSAREGAADALWQRKGSFLQSTNGESIIIGQGVDKTPAGYKLFVEEGILTEKVKVAVKSTADWSDKVFDTGYSLKSLDEVGKYIQANKHLPGVPSAKEMVEQGNDLHKTDAKLLEKIEELTLYSIQLEKTTKQQESKLRQQQADMDELKQLVRKLIDRK